MHRRNNPSPLKIKKVRHIVRIVLWSLAAIYVMLVVLLHIPAIQVFIGNKVSGVLAELLDTKVEIGRVDIGLPGHIIIDRLNVYDRSGKQMLSASRLSANADIIPLFKGRISISSAQLFGMKALLYKDSANAPANFQFVIDALSPKKPETEKTPLDLHIHSLIIRNSMVRYDRHDLPPTPGKLNTAHLNVSGISAHLILNLLTNDSVSLNCKRLAMEEASGLKLNAMSFRLNAGRKSAEIKDFNLRLPSTDIALDRLYANYSHTDGKIDMSSLRYTGEIGRSKITPSDVSSLLPIFKTFNSPLFLSAAFDGTASSVRVGRLAVSSSDRSLSLTCNGSVRHLDSTPSWFTHIDNLSLNAATIDFISQNLKGQSMNVPDEVVRIGNATYRGEAGGRGADIHMKGLLTTDAGRADIRFDKKDKLFDANIKGENLNLEKILADEHFGLLAANIHASGRLKPAGAPDIKVKGVVSRMDYNNYTYRNIEIDGGYADNTFSGKLGVNDPNGKLNVEGMAETHNKELNVRLTALLSEFNPKALNLSKKYAKIGANIDADFTGKDVNKVSGMLKVRNFSIEDDKQYYRLEAMDVEAGYENHEHYISMTSDFGSASLRGVYEYETLLSSITNMIGSKLPTLPGLPPMTKEGKNSFTISADIMHTDWLNALLGTNIHTNLPIRLDGMIDDRNHRLEMMCSMPDFTLDGNRYENGFIRLSTPDDTLRAESHIRRIGNKGDKLDLSLKAFAADNHLTSSVSVNDNKPHGLRGTMNVDANFYMSEEGNATAAVKILPSRILIGDTVWSIKPAEVAYSKQNIEIRNFAIEHGNQHLRLSGRASAAGNDSITADLKDIDVAYMLSLVNFRSVKFSGRASGNATLKSLFNNPSATASLTITDFLFADGEMGTLYAEADWNKADNRINIDALADNGPEAATKIDGYVSLEKSYIDLGIKADGTKIQFMETFCRSFMRDVKAQAKGNIRVFGPLKGVNLEGLLVVNGDIGISSLNTTYTMVNDTIRLEPDNIIFKADTIYDRNHNMAIVSGKATHRNLGRFAYDINIDARNLLAYDFKDYNGGTFFGTVFATGRCGIKGKSGEVNIDVDVTPQRGSFLEYNVVSPDAVDKQQFITWHDRTPADSAAMADTTYIDTDATPGIDMASDMRINFLINCTPNVSLRLLMDPQSGDRITLNGSGVIRATYYNKGAFQMFGNYLIDHGTYKLTIQNVIKKEFNFQQGSTIAFGGNPYDAVLNMKAQYMVNGVSLSDLNIGRSFSGNTIKVNCLMNISGTPNAPHIDFGLEMPTLSADAEHMVRSLMNTEEETNQQVLYLLAVGRFYNSGNNNAQQEGAEQQSQTALAMQSILSGTISQQISSVLSSLVNTNNWNFGANISTGDEGWNNAEYEGLLSGRLLNNRLLFNGQFGYRDNPNATTSFIGDFDIRYLLFPNGNLAINIYSQTNDRYFTRNSLSTQGVGLVMKKDFNGWRELFGLSKKKKRSKKK